MATVTGITAAKADEILGQSIVSGQVNASGHLILTRHDGATIDGGDFTAIVSDILGQQVQQKVDTALPAAIAGTVIDKGSVTGALTIPEFNTDNMPNAMVKVVMTGNVTFDRASLPSAPKPNTQWALRLQQDATGGRTFMTTGFKKSYGSIPITTTANAVDLVVFIFDGTDWLVGLMGADFK